MSDQWAQLRPSCSPLPSPQALSSLRKLRISVTDSCNFRCRYCMPPKGLHRTSSAGPLSFEELAENVRWLVQHAPIERIKLTGGEPLVRAHLEDLISTLVRVDGIREVSMTTNGSLLASRAKALRAAGLARVNVSLDSVDPARFTELSRGAHLEHTIEGIHAAIEAGLAPLKLNAVLQRSTWMSEVPPLLDLAAQHGFEIRFIELMRTGTERTWCDSEMVSAQEVKSWLATQTSVVALDGPLSAPAQQTVIQWNGAALRVGWIEPRSHPFCASCERLRMDSRGRLRRCLMDPATLDVAKLRRCDDAVAAEAFRTYMAEKRAPLAMDCESGMNQIGG
jgi:cyclic pyranopterin phosphate synthase